MELTRRSFARLLAAGSLAWAAGLKKRARSRGPVRAIRALAGRVFPGKVRALSGAEVRRTGPWAG
jgi:hypothetical protein